MVIIASVVIVLALIVLELLVGFPFEHIIANNKARRYVTETYGLTPTKTQASILLGYPITVTVWVEEKPYDFDVKMSRFVFTFMSDSLLNRTVEHIMGTDLNDYVFGVTKQNGRASVYIISGPIKDFSLSDVEKNPGIVFEKRKSHYCSIVLYDDLTLKNYEIDYALVYSIYNQIFELGLYPKHIFFSYYDIKGKDGKEVLSIYITNGHFPKINSPDDIKPFFDEAIQKLDKKR